MNEQKFIGQFYSPSNASFITTCIYYNKPTNMHTHLFQNNTDQSLPDSPMPTPVLAPFDEEESSQNQLNLGFIADDSKWLMSDSQSVASDGYSISFITALKGNNKVNSPYFLRLQEEMSGMDEWSQQLPISFAKCCFKRSNPSIEQEDPQAEQGNRCTKKKMNQKMKVITIDSSSKKQKQGLGVGYLLRSRGKIMDECSQQSSDQMIQKMINQIDEKKKATTITKFKRSDK